MMFLPEFCDNDTLPPTTCNPQPAIGPLPCDAWHHYYHYQSSAQYLWLAETLRVLGRPKEAHDAYERAIFQDHFNEEALNGKNSSQQEEKLEARIPTYSKHSFFDLEFCSFIGEPPNDATKPHDEGATALLAGNIPQALVHLEKAIAASAEHSNSYFTRGKCRFLEHKFDRAAADFSEAIRLSHLWHDAYHRAASGKHLERGMEFLKSGQLDLAINDFTKALNLHRGNKQALVARAEAYRLKGNEKLAQEDDAIISRICASKL